MCAGFAVQPLKARIERQPARLEREPLERAALF